MRTLKKQEQREKNETEKEEEEVEKTERVMVRNMDSKTIVLLFILLVVVVIVVIGAIGPQDLEGSEEVIERIEIPMTAHTTPEEGLPPGSNGGLRVEIENSHDEVLENVEVWARAPEGSGIEFDEGELAVKAIPYFETDGIRELYYDVHVDQDTEEGEYMINIEAINNQGLNSTTSAKLIVRVGRPDETI
jgi:hypothetical protein